MRFATAYTLTLLAGWAAAKPISSHPAKNNDGIETSTILSVTSTVACVDIVITPAPQQLICGVAGHIATGKPFMTAVIAEAPNSTFNGCLKFDVEFTSFSYNQSSGVCAFYSASVKDGGFKAGISDTLWWNIHCMFARSPSVLHRLIQNRLQVILHNAQGH